MKKLVISPYKKEWIEDFYTIEKRLDSFLHNLIINIHHIGSTSVPYLSAKPIIDINIEYEFYFDEIKTLLEKHNYLFEGDKGIKERYAFRYLKTDLPEHHLYVTHKDAYELHKQLHFRNILRKFKLYRDMYQDKKLELVKENNTDRVLYTDSKTETILFITKESDRMRTIYFAGGCFWGVEAYFKMIEGVKDTEVGYMGEGETTYKEVCNGSGHAEAVYIHYDNEIVSLETLLDHLFNIIDPTSINKQGPDIGVQYRTGIYNYDDEELSIIKKYFTKRQKEYKKPIAIELKQDMGFIPAETYHQDYLDKNQNGYCHVDLNSHKNVK